MATLHCKCKRCGGPAPAGERCTNGHCGRCHRTNCTPGGATTPGHLVIPDKAPWRQWKPGDRDPVVHDFPVDG